MLGRMLSVDESGSREWASRVVRRFAAATNLLIVGRRFAVWGDGPLTSELSELLIRLGARPVEPNAAPHYLFVTGENGHALDGPALERVAFARPDATPLVIDAGSKSAAAIEPSALGSLRSARAGVHEAELGGRTLFVVSATAAGSATTDPLNEYPQNEDPQNEDPQNEDPALRIAWARRFMPVTSTLAATLAEDGLVRGLRIGISMVLEPKTANLAILLKDAGAKVSVFSHAAETDDAVADALREAGIPVDARRDADSSEEHELALAFVDRLPQLLLDDGSHIIRLIHRERPELLTSMIGAAEETTSGLRPLRAMSADGTLRLPVIAVNDARCKTLFDNRYGTGQSCVFTIVDLLDVEEPGIHFGEPGVDVSEPGIGVGEPGFDLGAPGVDLGEPGAVMDGKRVVVAGFGPVGEGVARNAAALGASVIVAELDPVRALEAIFAGYLVAPLIEAVQDADLVISATGVENTVGLPIILACRDRAAIAVAGGVDGEVAIEAALSYGAVCETVRPKVERFTFPGGSSVLILDNGGCINVTAGEGNPIEIMDLSFAVQLSAVRMLVENRNRPLAAGVHPIDPKVDKQIGEIALHTFGPGRHS
jgi:adenosylhomocysteinase